MDKSPGLWRIQAFQSPVKIHPKTSKDSCPLGSGNPNQFKSFEILKCLSDLLLSKNLGSSSHPTYPALENCTKPETRVSYRAFNKGTLFDSTQKVSHTIALFDPHQIGDLTVPVSKKRSVIFFWIPIFALQCMIEVDVNEFHSFSSAGNNRLPFISIIFPHEKKSRNQWLLEFADILLMVQKSHSQPPFGWC